MTERRKLIISRATWARGDRPVPDAPIGTVKENLLLDDEGMMCCLGFSAKQLCQATEEEIRGHGAPDNIAHVFRRGLEWLLIDSEAYYPEHSSECLSLIETNDADSVSESERESKIIEIFRANGVEVEFTD